MSTPIGPPLADSFLHQVLRLNRALREAFEQRLARHQVTVAEWGVLVHCSHGVETPAGLADCLGIDRAAVTRLLDQLEQKGLFSREPNPADRRSTVVRLTRKGHALVPRLIEHAEAIDQESLGHMPENDRAQLRRLLKEVIGNLFKQTCSDSECPEG